MASIQKKVCLLGDFAVGKTSLVRRFVEGIFEDKYLSTIGAKIDRKEMSIHHASLTLLIWDLAGGEKFNRVVHSYYRGAAGAILVCDVTRLETLGSLEHYAHDFRSVNPGAPFVIVGNKTDLADERRISDTELDSIAAKLSASWFAGSAKTGENVETVFRTLGESLVECEK